MSFFLSLKVAVCPCHLGNTVIPQLTSDPANEFFG